MAALAGIDGVHLPAQAAATRDVEGRSEPAEPVYLRLPVILDSEARCAAAHRALLAGGYGAGRMYRRTMAEFFPAYADGAYPGAEQVARRLLTLPTHHYLSEYDAQRMAGLVEAALHPAQGEAQRVQRTA